MSGRRIIGPDAFLELGDVVSLSSDESESDSEPVLEEEVNATQNDGTRPKGGNRQATPNHEPNLELRNEVKDIVEQVDQWKAKLAKKQKDVDEMEKMTGTSFEDLDKMKETYRRVVKKFNKNRKDGFKDFEMAWKGICPGCKECRPGRGHVRKLPLKHAIGSMDTKLEAMMIRIISDEVAALNERLAAVQAEALSQEEGEEEADTKMEDGEEEGEETP